MSLSVTTSPYPGTDNGIFPIGTGELTYVFQEGGSIAGKPDYRVEIVFEFLSLPVFSFRPDSTLKITANIAAILRTVLMMSETPSERSLITHIKYQAVWTGGSDAQVDLTLEPLFLYIGSNNLLNKRTRFSLSSNPGYDKLLLDTIYGWEGRTTYVDFISLFAYPIAGMVINASEPGYPSLIFEYTGNVISLQTTNFSPSKKSSVSLVGYASEQVWSTSTALSKNLDTITWQGYGEKFTASASLGGFYKVKIRKVGNPSGGLTFAIQANSAGLPGAVLTSDTLDCSSLREGVDEYVLIDLSSYVLTSATVYHFTITAVAADAENYYMIYVSSSSTYAGGNAVSKTGGTWSNQVLQDLNGTVLFTPDEVFTQEIVFMEECSNPLYLKWINDYGGISTWLFDYNQIFSIVPNESEGRYKKMIVFLQSKSLEIWKMIEELNRSGAEYGDNQKLGAYVVDITDEDNPINIFVESNTASTATKARGNNAQLVLRYPLIDNIEISA